MEVNPLNPSLYNSLRSRFGEVRISNEGEIWQERMVKDPYDQKKFIRKVISAGEHYRVCCPYCTDRRFRLYVNYRFNTKEGGKTFGKNLVLCHNERCVMTNFLDELKPYISNMPELRRPDDAGYKKLEVMQETTLPGSCMPVSELDPNSAPYQYLVNRGFDPVELYKTWGVQYCWMTPPEDDKGFIPGTRIHARLVRNRIIIPIRWEGKLVGWQARAIDASVPKYYTSPGLKKSQLLFNGDEAKKHKFGVVVEGPFDAFRVGPRAVALLGKSMSNYQRDLILSYWSSGSVCIMLDADAVEDMQVVHQSLNPGSFRQGSFIVPLPGDLDPGDMQTEDIWSLIVSHARNRGVTLAAE